MTQPILNMHTWVSLPHEVRFRIRRIFKIPQSGNVFVNDGKIETDGTSPIDFLALSVDKMQTYLTLTETDFYKLFDLVVAKVVREIEGIPEEVKVEEVVKTLVESIPEIKPEPKKRGRPKIFK